MKYYSLFLVITVHFAVARGQNYQKVEGNWFLFDQGQYDDKTFSYSYLYFDRDTIPAGRSGNDSVKCYFEWKFDATKSLEESMWCKNLDYDGQDTVLHKGTTDPWELIDDSTIVFHHPVNSKKQYDIYYKITFSTKNRMRFDLIRTEKIKIKK